jgi:nucleotide-binding universal stress UspA family protein
VKPRILVAFDFSPIAERALAWAADLQRTSGGPPLRMVHAITSRPPGTADITLDMLLPNENELGGLEVSMREAAHRVGAEAQAEVVIAASGLGDIILDVAKREAVDLIVMGTHGRTGVKRAVLGSVAEHVMRHADCPVVAVHQSKNERAA